MRRNSKRKRKARPQENVELNMAAMLDMAFQLLAFFILTFKPSDVESQIRMRMPPEKSVTQGASANPNPNPPPDVEDSFSLPIAININATADGDIARVVVASREIQRGGEFPIPDQVNAQLASMLKEPSFDSIQIFADESLQYQYLMQIVDVCAKQTLSTGEPMAKISIAKSKKN
jgi:biopolymer transport protein ExbD